MTLGRVIDHLDLGDERRLVIVEGADGLAALPAVLDGEWRRAHPGDGVAEAMLRTACRGTRSSGRFTITSWVPREALGERAVGVDQTNESVVVGEMAVVKWATHLQDGPHPAPRRIGLLRAAGFAGMPAPWGLVTWRPDTGAETLAVTVDEYLPGAVDGWTWAVRMMTEAALGDTCPARDAAAAVGHLIAELHAALAGTAAVAGQGEADRWRRSAFETLDTAMAVGESPGVTVLRERRTEVAAILDRLGDVAGQPVIEGHGDLHVGQVLRAGNRFSITDFDGNPVLSPAERMNPIPAALDVAGMAQSFAHSAVVARKYTELDAEAGTAADTLVRATFLDAYSLRLSALGCAGIYQPALLRPLRIQQVLREIIYAAKYLPRWMYVPDAALPALLDEGSLS